MASSDNSKTPNQGLDISALRDIVGSVMEKRYGGDRPGAVVALTCGGRTLGTFAYGRANWEFDQNWSDQTFYTFYSLTKTMVMLAMIELKRQGNLVLNDPIQRFLPDFPEYEWPILVRHLANHTSGLYQDEKLLQLTGATTGVPVSLDDLYKMTKCQAQLMHEPGTFYSYSDTAARLLARIMTSITGEDFGSSLKRLLFEPAGMATAHVAAIEPLRNKNRASSYAPYAERNNPTLPPSYVVAAAAAESSGDGAAVGTIRDLAAFLLYLSSRLPDGSRRIDELVEPSFYCPGMYGAYRYCVNVLAQRGTTYYSHLGVEGKVWAYYPDYDLGIAIMKNDGRDAETRPLCERLFNALLPCVASVDDQPESSSAYRLSAQPNAILSRHEEQVLRGCYVERISATKVEFDDSVESESGRIQGESFTMENGPEGGYQTSANDYVRARWKIGGPAGEGLHMQQSNWNAFRPLERPSFPEYREKDLEKYLGRYRSREFGATYDLDLHGSALQLRIGSGICRTQCFRLKPLCEGIFEAEGDEHTSLHPLTVKFLENPGEDAGRVTAMIINTNGVMDLLLDRAIDQ